MENPNGRQGGQRRQIRFADLFSGIGAMRLGFELACVDLGIAPRCLGFSEIDDPATATYLRHFEGTPALGDVKALAASRAAPDCDFVLAGFPCPPWSAAGKRRGFKDERGRLFYALARIIGQRRPRAFLLENVRGLLSHDHGRTLAAILDVLRRQLGYVVIHAILNSRDFGVPQNRPRIYIVGFRYGDSGFQFPEPTDPTKRLRDILETDPVHPRHYVTEHELERLRRHKARHQNKGNGFGYSVIDPVCEVAGTLMSSNWGREKNFIADDCLSPSAVLPGRKSPISPELIRRLTPLEWERLQGVPDGFTAGQADGHRYRQLGNAVTVPVIRAIARNLLEALTQPGNAVPFDLAQAMDKAAPCASLRPVLPPAEVLRESVPLGR